MNRVQVVLADDEALMLFDLMHRREDARAPNLSEFNFPVSRLIAPSNALSISEGEYLFQGDNLINYLVKTLANPFGGG
jgi:hypothetical protein